METQLDISRLLVLRKVTRAISDLLTGQLRSHLHTLSPLFQPKSVFGEFVRGATKQSVKGEEEAFQEVRGLYTSVASASPFNLRKEIESPLDVVSTTLELIPAEYTYEATAGSDKKVVTVTTPLKWNLSYTGFGVRKMREYLASQMTSGGNDLYQGILHNLVLHCLLNRRPGIGRLLNAMRFSVSTSKHEALGQLPVITIEAPVGTIRPSDDVVIQTTEISGTVAFEEVVSLEAIQGLQDPLKDQLVAAVRGVGPQLI